MEATPTTRARAVFAPVLRSLQRGVDFFAQYTGDPEEDRRTRVVIGFAFAGIGATAPVAAANGMANPQMLLPGVVLVALFLIVLFRLRAGMGVTAAAHVLMAISLVVIQFGLRNNGGVLSPEAAVPPAIVVAAAMLLPRRSWPWASLWIASGLIHGVLREMPSVDQALPPGPAYGITHASAIGLAYGLALIFERGRRKAWDRLAEEKKEVERQHRELAATLDELHMTQHHLVQAQKMEALGRLAGGAAHEINTPVQYVRDNVVFLDQTLTDLLDTARLAERLIEAADGQGLSEEAVAELADALEDADLGYAAEDVPAATAEAKEGLDQIRRIVVAMKEFAAAGEEQPEECDLNHALQGAVIMCEGEWKDVAILDEAYGEIPPVSCRPSELRQVFLNILRNAIHAVRDAPGEGGLGRISVATAPVEGGVEISIEDSGPGVPEEIAHRIFDPFFTTRAVGKGIGAGLSLAYRVVVDNHDGSIECINEPGRGARFVIRLPVAIAESATGETAA